VALTKINKKHKPTIFILNIRGCEITKDIIFNGTNQPPKNRIAKIADIKIMLLYSAKKNMANMIDEYSVLYPATSSASASVKSKGVLFVSANIEIKKIIAQGSNGQINQPVSS
jgi:hypothetical protein